MLRLASSLVVLAVVATGADARAELKLLPFDAVQAGRLKPPGKVVGGLRWSDRRGENLLVFSRAESTRTRGGETERSASLCARHYAGGKLVREVKDHVARCELDLTLAIVPGSEGATDLDRDEIGEATFAYKLGCRSDVSPLTLKLLVLEGGEKHILRGETRVDVGNGERVGGSYKADPASFKRAPVLLAHARKVWQAIVEEKLR
jgi:hypothetical protein